MTYPDLVTSLYEHFPKLYPQWKRAVAEQGLGALVFLSEMGEERYDPAGMQKVLEDLPTKPDMIIAIDRTLGEIMYGVSGGYLAQVNFTAPGTHPLTSSGVPPAPLAMAKAIEKVCAIERPPLGPPPPPDIEATPHFLLNINVLEASTPTITGGGHDHSSLLPSGGKRVDPGAGGAAMGKGKGA